MQLTSVFHEGLSFIARGYMGQAFFEVGTTSKGKKIHYAHWLGISLKVPKSRGWWFREVALLKYHIRLRGACIN